jgi:phosphomevalonate kinase
VRVRAPGKLVLTGAYAVLEGAPAVVLAIDRHAVADTSAREPNPSAEVRQAIGDADAPTVDARRLHDDRGSKLGLGSSAAVLVASLGAIAASRGQDVSAPGEREELFATAREAHARTQQGGSGIDVAASVFGGALRYELRDAGRTASMRAVALPKGAVVSCYWSGGSVRTSDLRARVDGLRARDRGTYDVRLRELGLASEASADAIDRGDVGDLVGAARAMSAALEALGHAADAPVFTPAMSQLAREADRTGAAFLPSGAGGGDVAVHVGTTPPTEAFVAAAGRLGMIPLELTLDYAGVRVVGDNERSA